jgi:zinc transporter ZupT
VRKISDGIAIASLFGSFFLLVIGFVIISFVAFIWALIDIARSKKDTGWKIVWALICFILGVIGALVYYFVEKRKK